MGGVESDGSPAPPMCVQGVPANRRVNVSVNHKTWEADYCHFEPIDCRIASAALPAAPQPQGQPTPPHSPPQRVKWVEPSR